MRKPSDAEQLVSAAWEVAAGDLGLSLIRPTRGVGVTAPPPYVVWVEHFGSTEGTVCGVIDAEEPEREALNAWAHDRGMYCSWLSHHYGVYDRDLFAATLDDWGWFGSGDTPGWYTGLPWADE
jgi:hypothetical protein